MTDPPEDRNVIITGFMGTGKTTVGRLLAHRLQRRFFDMDALIEEEFGKSIAQVFIDDGEPAFRMVEARLCTQLASERGTVVSTGGGALVNPANRETLEETGVVFCLTANPDAILDRLDEMHDRPLLPGTRAERTQRIQSLLEERRPAYAAIRRHIDTTGREPGEIVEDIVRALAAEAEVPGMTLLPVKSPSGTYDIGIGAGLLDHIGALLAHRDISSERIAVVSNPVIADSYYGRVSRSFEEAGFEPFLCIVPEGERHKNLDAVRDLYGQFLSGKLDRRGTVVALGGGVVGDMAGFAAATYLRGVDFVQAPTSLLSMVDASVGGKTGVDLPEGKNLVGAFKQPRFVAIDTEVLATLPAAEFRSGLAEVIKHGIIGAPELFSDFEGAGPISMEHLVASAVRVKIEVVEDDPFESGRRAVLNLGHTFGHALELVSGYSIRHGEGVAMGMVAAAELAAFSGYCGNELVGRIRSVIERHDLPVRANAGSVDQIVSAMGHDKKRQGSTLRFVIPRRIGDVIVIDNPGWDAVRSAIVSITA